jgi:hypothetical protein
MKLEEYPPDNLTHLTFWQFQGQPYWQMARGFPNLKKYDVPATVLSDFAARFQPVIGGYVFKCRIPWAILGLNAVPYGKELGFCWETTWSDRNGSQCVGKLTDFFDPDQLRNLEGLPTEAERVPGKQSYQRPQIWGKAICGEASR